ncbi:hypothetical protein [Caldifermentibacillus hisashii]|jgi:hypothetical protein|nr:hypothetical protein CEJ87_15145 [Caldifermentibacillus hisashii]
MYIAKISRNSNDEVCFYFLKNRVDYMKDLIKGLGHQFSAPLIKTKYPPYESSIQKAMKKMDKRKE